MKKIIWGVIITIVLIVVVGLIIKNMLKPLSYDNFIGYEDTNNEEQTMIISIPCESDEFDCNNFASQSVAQDLFEKCGGVDFDVHNLDPDKNGIACEDFDYSKK